MPADTALGHLVWRAQAEYIEMPGLCLTRRQAQRLWGLDEAHCLAVLDALVESRFLVESQQGCFVRTGLAHRSSQSMRRSVATSVATIVTSK